MVDKRKYKNAWSKQDNVKNPRKWGDWRLRSRNYGQGA